MGYFVHETAVVDNGAAIGDKTNIWHFSHIMTNAAIGGQCNLGQNVFVGKDVKIGDRVKIQNNVSLYTGVECEDEVFLGPSMVFTNIKNPRSAINRGDQFVKTLVKKGATIGANATIICGVTIGRYAFAGAGSVITHDIPDYALFLGNPARHIGWMSEYGHRLQFDKEYKARCPESDQLYHLKGQRLEKID